MVQMSEQFPQYGFEIHKGYATQAHLAALNEHGPCELHRRSFAPVASAPETLALFSDKEYGT
jgi:ribonuclease HII